MLQRLAPLAAVLTVLAAGLLAPAPAWAQG